MWSPSIPGKPGENVEIILSKKGWKNSALKSFSASFATIVNKELYLRFGEMGILGEFKERVVGMPSVHSNMLSAMGFSL